MHENAPHFSSSQWAAPSSLLFSSSQLLGNRSSPPPNAATVTAFSFSNLNIFLFCFFTRVELAEHTRERERHEPVNHCSNRSGPCCLSVSRNENGFASCLSRANSERRVVEVDWEYRVGGGREHFCWLHRTRQAEARAVPAYFGVRSSSWSAATDFFFFEKKRGIILCPAASPVRECANDALLPWTFFFFFENKQKPNPCLACLPCLHH